MKISIKKGIISFRDIVNEKAIDFIVYGDETVCDSIEDSITAYFDYLEESGFSSNANKIVLVSDPGSIVSNDFSFLKVVESVLFDSDVVFGFIGDPMTVALFDEFVDWTKVIRI